MAVLRSIKGITRNVGIKKLCDIAIKDLESIDLESIL